MSTPASRVVVPELLDGLCPQDPAALRSRRDLQRVHRAMGTRVTVLRALRRLPLYLQQPRSVFSPLKILELGAGDGSLLLGVARELHGTSPPVALTLLDRQAVALPQTIADYAAVGWVATVQTGDALDWAAANGAARSTAPAQPHWDLIVANLFLHHFSDKPLAALLSAVAARTDHFFACEPRRAWLARAASHLVGALGVNAVTCEDAVLSVHAGFRGDELRTLWPAGPLGWTLREYRAGLFSHCITASRFPVLSMRSDASALPVSPVSLSSSA